MSTRSPANLARKAYHSGRRWIHPVVDSFLPVTYTSAECRRRIQVLDPSGARSYPVSNPDTDRRVVGLAASLGVDADMALQHLEEARRVEIDKATATDQPDLASPMCSEDRYATYVVARCVAPTVAVETGIAHGISSACLLAAMETGGTGKLISIEIDDDPRIGQCVPASLRHRWVTHTGSSLELLSGILAEQQTIDLFLHDSDHRYRHVWRELELAWPYVRPGGVICAHDILHNNAFPRFVQKHESEIAAWFGSINFGVIRKTADH